MLKEDITSQVRCLARLVKWYNGSFVMINWGFLRLRNSKDCRQWYTSSPDYLYRRNGIGCFTRNVPSDRRHVHVIAVLSFHYIRARCKEPQSRVFCLTGWRYFESLRLERFHSQELGLKFSVPADIDVDFAEVPISEAFINIHSTEGALAETDSFGARQNEILAISSSV